MGYVSRHLKLAMEAQSLRDRVVAQSAAPTNEKEIQSDEFNVWGQKSLAVGCAEVERRAPELWKVLLCRKCAPNAVAAASLPLNSRCVELVWSLAVRLLADCLAIMARSSVKGYRCATTTKCKTIRQICTNANWNCEHEFVAKISNSQLRWQIVVAE